MIKLLLLWYFRYRCFAAEQFYPSEASNPQQKELNFEPRLIELCTIFSKCRGQQCQDSEGDPRAAHGMEINHILFPSEGTEDRATSASGTQVGCSEVRFSVQLGQKSMTALEHSVQSQETIWWRVSPRLRLSCRQAAGFSWSATQRRCGSFQAALQAISLSSKHQCGLRSSGKKTQRSSRWNLEVNG